MSRRRRAKGDTRPPRRQGRRAGSSAEESATSEPEQPTPGASGDGVWSRVQAALSLSDHPLRTRTVVALVVVAWGLAVAVRVLWLGGLEDSQWLTPDGHRILETNDALYYGSGVLDAVGELSHDNRRVPGPQDNFLVAVGAALASVLPVPTESVLTWLPAFLAGLLAIPLILIGRLLGSAWWGFSAALIAVVGYSYFFRTIPGYLDTDMVSVTVVLGVVGFLMAALLRGRHLWATCAALLALSAPWFHPGAVYVSAAIALMLAAYVLLFERKRATAQLAAIAFLAAFLPIGWPLAALVILAIHLAVVKRVSIPTWVPALTVALALVAVFLSPAVRQVLSALPIISDLLPDAPLGSEAEVVFVETSRVVIEKKGIGFGTLAERVAGNVPLLLIATLGYLLSMVRHRTMLLSLPIFGLGTLLAAESGGRYTTYAVPIAALGATYVAYLASRHLGRLSRARRSAISVVCAAAMTAGLLYPAVAKALRYPASPVMSRPEIATLQRLQREVKPGDYAIAWWDYGYRLWFYAGLGTLIDGSKNQADSFLVAQALFTDSARGSANLSRLAVERYAAARTDPKIPITNRLMREWRKIAQRGARRRGDEVPDRLAAKAGLARLDAMAYRPPSSTRDIYYYLPWRMLLQARFAAGFRQVPGLSQTEAPATPVLAIRTYDGPFRSPVKLNAGGVYDERRGGIVNGDRIIPLRDIYRLKRRRPGEKLQQRRRALRPEGKLSAVVLEDRRTILVLDQAMLHSLFIQMLVFEAHDPRFFELVERSTDAAIYRLRR